MGFLCNLLLIVLSSFLFIEGGQVEVADISATLPEIAKRHGYDAEIHQVVTDDDYVLIIHRINGNKGKKQHSPVFLQHGLFDSSNGWTDGENVSLALLLADEGYDVWLGNSRGNPYSNQHLKYYPSSPQYWNFSFDEMGFYDLPASINYVVNKTNSSLFYVGHSRGCAAFYIYASLFPEEAAKNIKLAYSLAPAVFLGHAKFRIKFLVNLLASNVWLFKLLGVTHFDSLNLMQFIGYHCDDSQLTNDICLGIIDLFSGYNKPDMEKGDVARFFTHTGDSCSLKDGLHFVQLIDTDEFRRFCYTEKQNMETYGSKKPPKYPLAKVKVPTYIYYGVDDAFINGQDAKKLAKSLPNNKFLKGVKNFNHEDFLISEKVREEVYIPILNVFKENE